MPGPVDGERFPVADIVARLDGGELRRAQLAAFDPIDRTVFDGLIGFVWVESQDELDAARRACGRDR